MLHSELLQHIYILEVSCGYATVAVTPTEDCNCPVHLVCAGNDIPRLELCKEEGV